MDDFDDDVPGSDGSHTKSGIRLVAGVKTIRARLERRKQVGTVGTVGTETGNPSGARVSRDYSCSDSLFTKSEQSEHFQPFGPRPALIGAEHSPPGFCVDRAYICTARLTPGPCRADTPDVAETTATGFDSLNDIGGHQPPRGYFYVRNAHGAPRSMAGRVGSPHGLPVPMSRSVNPTLARPPFDSGVRNSPRHRSITPWQLTPWRANVCTHPLHPSAPSRFTAPCAASPAPRWPGVCPSPGGPQHEPENRWLRPYPR